MKRTLLLPVLLLAAGASSCAMFTAWKSIPPPGGCDQCHSVPIANNWQVTYKAPTLTDERGRPYFQTEQYTMTQTAGTRPQSDLDRRKVEEQRCFECHRAPSAAHKERLGRFHH